MIIIPYEVLSLKYLFYCFYYYQMLFQESLYIKITHKKGFQTFSHKWIAQRFQRV